MRGPLCLSIVYPVRLGLVEFLKDDRNHRGEKIAPMWERILLVLFGIAVVYVSLRFMCGTGPCGTPYWDNHIAP